MIDFLGFLLIAPSTVIVSAVVCLIVYARWHRGTLEPLGIPVVKSHWLLGSNWNYMSLNHHREDVRRFQQLGPVYGVYNGRTPEVFVCDVEMIHRILYADAGHFYDKIAHDFGHPTPNQMTEFLNGEKWKVMRHELSPLFTLSKLKTMSQPLQELCDEHVGVLNSEVMNSGGRMKVEIAKFLPPFAVEALALSLCGMKLKDVRSPDNELVKQMRVALLEDLKFDWTYNILMVFPWLMSFLKRFISDPYDFFDSVIKEWMNGREQSGIKIKDTLNTLLEMRRKLGTKEYSRIGLNNHTIYGQAYLFFVAGFTGVNTTISYLLYNLAKYPETQRKLREEVDQVLKDSTGVIDFDTLGKLPYLTACLLETLRKDTTFHRLDRICTKDWEFKGWKIKKGMHVRIPMRAVHLDPQVHEDPQEFRPDRFMPGNKDKMDPCGYLAWGLGHRTCLGGKIMLETLKSWMVRVVRDFEIVERGDTGWNENYGNHYLLQMDPIYVDLLGRNKESF